MTDVNGRFVWYDLLTTDPQAATEFYLGVTGWAAEDLSAPEMTYILLKAGETPVAGAMHLVPEALAIGSPPHWGGYVAVANADAATEKARGLGASVVMEPKDIPGKGRVSVIGAVGGAVLCLFQGNGDPVEPQPMTPGHFGWNELFADDVEQALGFYSELFGWVKHEAIDMGEMGTYQIYGLPGLPLGGMMKTPPGAPAHWRYYITVSDIDACTAKVADGGGRLTLAPTEVPGGAWIVQGVDPQGAHFALVGQRPNPRD